VPEHEPQSFEECAVCGRTVLRGEQVVEYVTPDGESRATCALCRTRAEEAGWIRADSPDAHRPPPARRRRGLRLGSLNLRERAGRLAERAKPATSPEPEPDGEPFRRRSAQPAPAPDAERDPDPEPPPPPPPPPDTPERRIRRGLDRFNDSGMPRVVGGLIKTLGQPQAAVREFKSPTRVEVTVAWELSWYRWDVLLDGDEEPTQVGKGSEMSELDDDGLDWNASVDDEGRVRWRESS
jgi:hypothetical protein